MSFPLTVEQLEAVELCTSNEAIVGTTGQAGTGKTSIMKAGYLDMIGRGMKVAVCAPTGKAAKRITEATGIPEAMTQHRLLEFPRPGEIDPETGKPRPWAKPVPKRNAGNPLEVDAVFVDEYSMVNWKLNDYLLDAMPPGCLLRVYGDMNQLQPIEQDEALKNEPSPFRTILDECPSVKLKQVHRNGGAIVRQGERILKGQLPQNDDDFFLAIAPGDEILDALDAWIEAEFDNGIDYLGSIDNQIITPSNKTAIGTAELNGHFMRRLYAVQSTGWYWLPRHRWDRNMVQVRKGVKVIQTANDYNLGVMNGEVGIVKHIDAEENIHVDFGDRTIVYPPVMKTENQWGFETKSYPQADLDLAWVVTTHKSQGSEYQNVVYVMNREARFTHRISNFYTAITRTRKTCSVITDEQALVNSISQR